ncbi:MAG: hypothetical protein LBF74_03620 [Treponema sp.]|jgi:hypothetical protein|nr:hypothetical protein [Treponema sp.]
MKKFMVLVIVLTLAAGFVAAQEEEDGGIGLTAGLEFGVAGVNVEDGAVPYLTPGIVYENSFGDFDVAAEVDYTLNFEDGVPQSLFAEEELGYNLSLSDTQGLTFILHNENDIATAPDFGEVNGDGSILEPNVTYTLGLSPGDFYVTAGLPVTYLPDFALGAYGTLGFGFSFGLGLEATFNLALAEESGYDGTDFLVSYGNDQFYAEVELNIDSEFKTLTITPEFDYFFKNFIFFVKAEFDGIGDEVSITPALGVTYSF